MHGGGRCPRVDSAVEQKYRGPSGLGAKESDLERMGHGRFGPVSYTEPFPCGIRYAFPMSEFMQRGLAQSKYRMPHVRSRRDVSSPGRPPSLFLPFSGSYQLEGHQTESRHRLYISTPGTVFSSRCKDKGEELKHVSTEHEYNIWLLI
jgi:hypothetical protein